MSDKDKLIKNLQEENAKLKVDIQELEETNLRLGEDIDRVQKAFEAISVVLPW